MRRSPGWVTAKWKVRRATLLDVPVVARLIEPPSPRAERMPAPAVRLVLAHLGLEAGEFWVASGDDGEVRAAIVWLPPGRDADGNETAQAAALASTVRLHLGAFPVTRLEVLARQQDTASGWLELAVAAPGAEPALEELRRRAGQEVMPAFWSSS